MDFLFVNPINFDTSVTPQMGQLILNNILNKKYGSGWLNFDLLNSYGKIRYSSNMDENINIMLTFIESLSPSIVGFYTISNSFDLVVELAERLKKANSIPIPKIVFGGPHASVLAHEILESLNCFDVICIGESERIILPLVDALLGKTPFTDLKSVPGIVYLDEKMNIVENTRPPLLNANELGDYTIFDYEDSLLINSDYRVSIEGGRGCPYHCTFCSTSLFWGGKHRLKPIDTILSERNKYYCKYGTTKFLIVHDHFTANRQHIYDFCTQIQERSLPFEWACSSRTDVMDNELLEYMKKSGCTKIYFGIETGSAKMQKELNKNLNIVKAKEVMRYAKHMGLHITASYIYCFPNETIDNFKDTVKSIEDCIHIGIDVIQLHKYCLYSGSIEAEKVKTSMLYFDENNLRTLKIEKNAFTSYGIKLVQRYPKLFKQHYTFNTDVSKEFKYFDFFIVCVTMLNKHFKKTIKYILINQTLIDMYYAEKITLTDLSEKHFMYNNRKILVVYDNDMTKKLLNEMLNCLTQRVDLSNSNYLKAVYQFEYACYEFLSQKSNTCLLKFDFSITCLINNKKLIKENSYIILSKKNNTMYISKLTYEACFILTRIGKQFAEKLENDIFQDINEFIK